MNRQIDSLEALLQKQPAPDTMRVKWLVALANKLSAARPREAAVRARQAMRTAQQLKYPRGEAAAFMELAVCAYERGDLDSAEVFFSSSLALWKAHRIMRGTIRAQNGLASVYANRGKFNEALQLFIASLEVAERIGDKKMQVRALSNMGSLAEQLLDNERALRYYGRCLALADSVADVHEYETCLCNIAGLYLNEKKFDQAAPYVARALALNKLSDDAQNRGTMQMALGQIALAKKEMSKATTNFNSALALGQEVGDNYLMSRALLLLGRTAGEQAQHQAALAYYQRALPLVLEIGMFENIRDVYSGLAAAYNGLGQFEKAFQSQQKHIAFGDSAIKEKTITETRLLQNRFETERKEAQNRLQAAQLKTQQQVIRRRNTQLLAGAVVAALLLALAALLYNRRRLQQRVELEQERQRLERLRAAAVLEAEEAERRRIGSDLHDGVGQLLTAAKLNLHALGEELGLPTQGQQAMLQNA
ncbi:tetratricopeptide repeat protein, partial [Hymenobacter saemangeumensis]|uniref:ATP-binding protein n=1 Tax=Hymenobacter saemangeumensis TaxID=1084522 RepID=UPI0031E7CD8A